MNLISTLPIWQTMVSFGFFTIIICLMLVYSKLHWLLKSVVTFGSIIVFILAYQSITNSFGYPLEVDQVPGEFLIIGVDAQVPETGKTDGAIWYWVKPFDPETHSIGLVPRLYQVPFSEERYREEVQLKMMLQKNQVLIGKDGKINQPGNGGHPGDGSPGSSGLNYGNNSGGQRGIILIHPNSGLPSKSSD